ncbi:MAG TPA: hypothetical protein VFJ50_08380 [Gemmatimonadales bacterium]|nr:hypothetical protein [Gemmatimonadales bacterium]
MSHDFFSFAILFIIPIIAVIGGITMGIIRTLGQQRMAELARRERIAAIERGVDPDKLPPLAGVEGYEDQSYGGYGNGRLRRAHGLMIGGLITVAAGIGMMILFYSIEPEKQHYVIGTIPVLVGLALLLSSYVVWPRKK